MLQELRIKNFAVIDAVELQLEAGLNSLTGETGAGKSIILNALGLISGNRGSIDVIRHNQDEASVEALFEAIPEHVQQKLQKAGIDFVDELIIRRVISRSGKHRIFINGALCQLNFLAEIGRSLVHIYGQHEHHTLLDPENHLELLDSFGNLGEQTARMAKEYRALGTAWESLREVRESVERRKKERELLKAQVEEIANAKLYMGEEEELQEKKNILAHAEKLYQGSLEGQELLYEGESALVSRLGRYGNRLKELAAIDSGLQPTLELLNSALAQLNEANNELRHYAERVHFEPGALEQLEDRLAEIHRLKRKYNGNVEEVLKLQAQAESELRSLDRSEEEIPGLERAFEAAGHTAWEAAGALSLERERVAKRFKRALEKELKSLGLAGTVFEVRFLDLVDKEFEPPFVLGRKRITLKGIDQVEFYFSPNPGEPPKPLAKIASGGELSRLMLAIKSLVLTPGDIPTLLFDEVDAGIGGAVAEIVGKKLKQVAATHQVICVTHLPQIAALADSHHIVRKEVARGRTTSQVQKLNEKERVEEVARMLGGLTITEKTRRAAAEMVRGNE